MDVFEAVWTTRAMRRLDPDREVSDADIIKCIEAASKAATGGGREQTRYVVVRDPEVKAKIGAAYQKAGLAAFRGAVEAAGDNESQAARLARSGLYLAEHIAESPALIVVCSSGDRAKQGASVFPGVQNLFLAARALGLGTVMTTVHLANEAAVKDALAIPDDISTFCLVPIGYPLGRWGEAKRRPVSELIFWNRWGQPMPAPSARADDAART